MVADSINHVRRPRASVFSNLDLSQSRELFWISLRQAARPVASSHGKQRRPLLTLTFSMLTFGIMFSFTRRLAADPQTLLTAIVTTTVAIVAMGTLPDGVNAQEKYLEILYCRPVSDRTVFVSQIIYRLFYVFLMGASFSAVPLLSCANRFRVSAVVIAATFLLLILFSFATVNFCFGAVVYLTKWFSVERFRNAARYLLVTMLLISSLPPILVSASLGTTRGSVYSINAVPALKLLPTYWVAAFFTDGFDRAALLRRAGVIAILLFAAALSWVSITRRQYSETIEKMTSTGATPVSAPISVKMLGYIHALPVVGGSLIPRQSLGIASIILPCSSREDSPRLRVFSQWAIIFCIFLAALFKPSDFWLFLIMLYGFNTIKDGTQIIRQTSNPGGSWVFHSCPVEPAQFIKGIRLSVLFGFFSFPGFLTCILFFSVYGAAIGAFLSVSYLIQAALCVSLFLVISPDTPMSREINSKGALLNLLVSGFLTTGSLALLYAVTIVIKYFGTIGIAVAVAFIIALLTSNFLLTLWAARRLSQTEFTQ